MGRTVLGGWPLTARTVVSAASVAVVLTPRDWATVVTAATAAMVALAAVAELGDSECVLRRPER